MLDKPLYFNRFVACFLREVPRKTQTYTENRVGQLLDRF